jgi:hypothetical protein
MVLRIMVNLHRNWLNRPSLPATQLEGYSLRREPY